MLYSQLMTKDDTQFIMVIMVTRTLSSMMSGIFHYRKYNSLRNLNIRCVGSISPFQTLASGFVGVENVPACVHSIARL